MTTNGHDSLDDDLSAAARTLHREWESPALWPAIASQIEPVRQRCSWHGYKLAAAAALVAALGSATWWAWRSPSADNVPAGISAGPNPLLSDEALAELERSERQYTRAIDELARLAAPKLEMPRSQLLLNLRERLMTIDDAIDEARMQIDVNPFNAQLRQQLLFIYQEKRRTLEQIHDYDENTL